MRNKVAKQIMKECESLNVYRRMKKAYKARNVDDSPKNPPVLLKKKYKGESMEAFKKRRKAINKRKRERK